MIDQAEHRDEAAPAAGQANGGTLQSTNTEYSTESHPYLERKRIILNVLQTACRCKVQVRNAKCAGHSGPVLFRQLLTVSGEHAGFERILEQRVQPTPDDKPNDKYVTKGSKVSGTFTPIGFHPSELVRMDQRIIVCAGLSDGYRLHEATGDPVACGVGENNVKSIAEAIAPLNPDILVAVDRDDAGKRAGGSCGFHWAHPITEKDWSDVYQAEGLQAVRDQLAVYIKRPGQEAPPVADAKRPYDRVLEEAQALDTDSNPDDVERLVKQAAELPVVQKRKIQSEIKKRTGTPFSVMKEVERDDDEQEDVDHLQLAQQLADQIGPQNVLSDSVFVWRWQSYGVWEAQEDRSVKQWVQRYIQGKAKQVSKASVESIADLFKTEVFRPSLEFNVGPPECVNTPAGELILSDGHWQIHPHKREHYRTTQIPAPYDAQAAAPRFEQFLKEVFRGDLDANDKARALLEMIGYTLMAHCRHEKFIILVGSGANGKSVLLSVLEALAGPQNVAGVQPSQFDRSFQRAHLHGRLANIVTEIKQGEMIDDASLKGIVSGEPTTVEHKFKAPFTMRPFATCWFGTNHMPHTRDFSDALFRRALVVEFNNTFKPELGNCDPKLKDALMNELAGILRLALEAYAKALQDGFTMPESCAKAREQWRLEADQVAQFIESECEYQEGCKMEPQEVFNLYREWANGNGIHKQLTQRSFIDRLVRLGFERAKSNGRRYITGIKRAGFA